MSQNSVELMGYYGGDKTHALSAWTSTHRDLSDEKEARIPKLLKMLAENEHGTPFEKSMIHFLVRVEDATHIQILKHRIGVSTNGESARYKALTPTHYIPEDWPKEWQDKLEEHSQTGEALYLAALEDLTEKLGRKRAKESARYFMGKNNQLTLDVSFNFRSFMHFVDLRVDDAAQLEINNLTLSMLDLVRQTNAFDASLAAFGL